MTIRGVRLIALAAVVLAQSPYRCSAQSPLGFEVASIKRHRNTADSSDTNLLTGGRFTGSNVSVRKMIRIALGVEDNLMSGGPSWIDSESYDIDAKTGNAATITPEQFPMLMLALLQERFQLKFRRETKEAPVYWLVVAPNGPKLKAHTGVTEPSISTNSQGTETIMKATKMPVQSLAAGLKRQMGRPVEDHTGLRGEFDFELLWDREEAPDSALPSIFTALQEQLGLKLNPAKGPVEILVIDHIERASEN